jgi:hypothetical protein
MRFRRIYWVTEQIDGDGMSEVTGVFTSIPDLVDTGLGIRDISGKKAAFRVTLCELDSRMEPLMRFQSPDFTGFEADVRPILETGEMSLEEYNTLLDALKLYRNG